MTTIQDIIKFSKPHPGSMENARQTVLTDGKILLSIVGGAKGLYGDFENDFELAIMEVGERNFVTKYMKTVVLVYGGNKKRETEVSQ